MVDFHTKNRISSLTDRDIAHLPPSTLTDDFLAGLHEGQDIANDKQSLRMATIALVAFVFGLLLGSMLP
jgi:hypothetical protein